MIDEDAALGAGGVVLGQLSDLLEELGASLVIEEPGGEGLLFALRLVQSGERFVQYRLAQDLLLGCFSDQGTSCAFVRGFFQ